MMSVWEEAWERLNVELVRVASEVMTKSQLFWWRAGHDDNEAFPFRAHMSFGRLDGAPGEEELVVSVDFHKRDGLLTCATDICMGDGQILAQGPAGSIALSSDVRTIRLWIESQVEEAVAFVREQRSAISQWLA
jgi:hypothetical protein